MATKKTVSQSQVVDEQPTKKVESKPLGFHILKKAIGPKRPAGSQITEGELQGLINAGFVKEDLVQ